jgi:hypothetical protein
MSFDLADLMATKTPEPEKRGRGRPRIHANDAEKQAAFRAKKDLVRIAVDLPSDCVTGLNEYMKFKGVTKTEVFTKLIRQQLLRKR